MPPDAHRVECYIQLLKTSLAMNWYLSDDMAHSTATQILANYNVEEWGVVLKAFTCALVCHFPTVDYKRLVKETPERRFEVLTARARRGW